MAQRLGQAQPSVGYPQGAVSFLRALVAPDTAALGVWVTTARPDARWAEWLRRSAIGCRLPFTDCARLAWWRACRRNSRGLRAAMYYNAAGEAELRTRELADALDVLGAVGITPVLFKGAVLAYTAYPDPACRPMGDLDLWIDLEAMPPGPGGAGGPGVRAAPEGGTPDELCRPSVRARSSWWAARRAAA